MRLTSLRLKNFRQYDDRTITFNNGSTAIRGANEAGKSTLIEGLFYALGGADFCRNNDFVRWGAKKSECRVEATFVARNGDEIMITRTPNAAELLVNGEVLVTGQRPVNKASAERFGLANLTIARRIMFVEQGQIRGILEEANAKAVDTIESLTGLDIIDWLIQRVQDGTSVDAGVVRGQVQTLQESIETSQGELAELQAELPRIKEAERKAANLQEVEEGVKNAATASAEAAQAALASLPDYSGQLAKTDEQLKRLRSELSTLDIKIEHTRDLASAEPAGYQDLQLQLEAASEVHARNVARVTLASYLKTYPEQFWEGSYDSLVVEGKSYAERVENLRDEAQDASRELAKYEGMRVAGTCSICGLDVSEVPAAVAKNTELEAQIFRLQEVIARAKARMTDAQHTLKVLRELATHRVPDSQYLVRTSDDVWPPKFESLGEQEPTPDVQQLRNEIARRQRAAEDQRVAVLNLETLTARRLDLIRSIADEVAERDVLAKKDAGSAAERQAALDAVEETRTLAAEAVQRWGACSRNTAVIAERASETERRLARLEMQIAGWQQSIESAQDTLAKAAFNDELISSLRRARPLVANRLWDMVLKAVTQYLSRSRNQVSDVKKVDKSFTVNGHPFDSLSGSAIDMLGLAIRVALLKIFAPGVELMILDEPFGACDAERQRDALSFLLAMNIGQIFIVTHEPTTESVCDNVIGV